VHLYTILAQEFSYSIPIVFIMMEIHSQENTKLKKYLSKVLYCIENFYLAVKLHGLVLVIVYTNKN